MARAKYRWMQGKSEAELDRVWIRIGNRLDALGDKYFPPDAPMPRPIKTAFHALVDTQVRINRRINFLLRRAGVATRLHIPRGGR